MTTVSTPDVTVDGQPLTGTHNLNDAERALTQALNDADTRDGDIPPWRENTQRAARALGAVRHYVRTVDGRSALKNETTEQYVRDLLTDLRHLCALLDDKHSFDALAERAQRAYESEQIR